MTMALSSAEKVLGLDNTLTRSCGQTLSYVLNETGKASDSSRLLERLGRVSERAREKLRYDWACSECLAGNHDKAVELLREELERNPLKREEALADDDLEAVAGIIARFT